MSLQSYQYIALLIKEPNEDSNGVTVVNYSHGILYGFANST